jgi:hypothetical protein
MKKLTVLIAAMVMIASVSMAQYQNEYAKNRKVYVENYSQHNRNSRGEMMNINSFQKLARESIAYGIIDGSITSNEAMRLLGFAERIEIKENRFMRNGRLNNNQARNLKEDINELNRMIRKDIRDRERSKADVSMNRKRRPVYNRH